MIEIEKPLRKVVESRECYDVRVDPDTRYHEIAIVEGESAK